MTVDPQEHDEGLVSGFVLAQQRARWRALLGSPRRLKVTSRLCHRPDFDPRWLVPVARADQSPGGVERLLRDRGAPAECCVISCTALDGQVLPLREALDAVVGHSAGEVVSCIPGVLAYYEGEEAGERWLLHRSPAEEAPCRSSPAL